MADRRSHRLPSWYWALILVLVAPPILLLGYLLISRYLLQDSTGAEIRREHDERDSRERHAQLDDMRGRWESQRITLGSLIAASPISPQLGEAGPDATGQQPLDAWSQYPAALYCAQRLSAANSRLREVNEIEDKEGTDLTGMAKQIVSLNEKQSGLRESQRHLAKAQQVLQVFDSVQVQGRSAVGTVLNDLSESVELSIEQNQNTLEEVEAKRSELSNSLDNAEIMAEAGKAYENGSFGVATVLLNECKPPLPQNHDTALKASMYGQSAKQLLMESEQVVERWKTPPSDLDTLRKRLEAFCAEKPLGKYGEIGHNRCSKALGRIDALVKYHQLTGNRPSSFEAWLQTADGIAATPDKKIPFRKGIQAAFGRIVEARLPDTKLAGSGLSSMAVEYRQTRQSLGANLGSREHWLRFLAACEALQTVLPRTASLEQYTCRNEIDFSKCIVSDKCWPMVTRILATRD